MTCVYTPIDIAFPSKSKENEKLTSSEISNLVTDLLFLVDIIVNFMSAYHDEDMEIVEDRKKIANMYV